MDEHHEDDSDSRGHEEDAKEEGDENANENDAYLKSLYQKKKEHNIKKMFEGLTDHRQIVLDYADIERSYNVTIENDDENDLEERSVLKGNILDEIDKPTGNNRAQKYLIKDGDDDLIKKEKDQAQKEYEDMNKTIEEKKTEK